VKNINSRIRAGVARIEIEFEPNLDADKKYDEVVRELNALRPTLPDLVRLQIYKASTLDVNIVQVALVSDVAPYRLLDSLAEQLEDRLSAQPGVRTAERWGAPQRQVGVALDLGRLAQLGLPLGQVLGTIGGVGMWSFVVALPSVQAEFGILRNEASLPYTLAIVGVAFGGVLMGKLADRHGIVYSHEYNRNGSGCRFQG